MAIAVGSGEVVACGTTAVGRAVGLVVVGGTGSVRSTEEAEEEAVLVVAGVTTTLFSAVGAGED